MFSIIIQINRQTSFGGFYFLYFLFLLHICTAFLTISNAFNHDVNDKEEIIQLSMDSIHVIQSTESQITKNTEENVNDNEEKELLLTLLTSYDDNEFKINQQIDNEISKLNSTSSIRFIPSLLHFGEQSISLLQMQTVIIINEDSEPLELYSFIGTTNQFYSSFSKQTTLSPYGGNISINIYYLPRTIDITNSIFTLKTNDGNFSYSVSGIGKLNPFRLRPLINIEIPVNSTFEYTIQFYNPYNYSLNIKEIYTSDENLIIELLLNKNNKNRLRKIFQYHEQWYLKPYETKSIIKLNYFAYKLNELSGFICIKTNFSEKIIIPIEINVLNRPGIYSNVDLLEFSKERFISSIAASIKIPVYVFNHGLEPVMIDNVYITPKHRDYITVQYKSLQIPPDIHRLTQIADVTIHPNLIPVDIHHIQGYIQVHTSTNNEEGVLKIPFDERVLHGSLNYKKEETNFYISNNKSITEQCQPIRFFNRYNIPICVHDITIKNFELLSKYIQIKYLSSFVYLYPDQWNELLCVTLLQKPLSSMPFHNIQATVDVYTNLSYFNFPVHLYNGFLTLNLLTDHTNGGVKRNELDPFKLFITSIPVNTSRTVTFILTNSNPIDIKIEEFDFTLSNMDIRLHYTKLLNGNGNGTKTIFTKNKISQLVIPKQHQAIFLLTIKGTNPPKYYSESFSFKTHYQKLHINVNYEIINGSIEFVNKTPLHIDVFPNRLGTVNISVVNKFDEPVNVTRINLMTYGVCFSITWSNTSTDRAILQPNKIQIIGKLNFDITPLCKSIHIPSESTFYCGLNQHPEFKQRWDEHISVLNTYELDHIIVKKFRNLWKEWTSLIQKQQFQTNLWLYTSRANISWPVTIGFVWPSVIEQISSSSHTPAILDFQVTLINITKTQNIIITNPSSDLLNYSVKLLNNYSSNSESLPNNPIFNISTTSKRIEIINNTYKFNLLPNEQITFNVFYRPTSMINHEMYFIVRNNLTIIESILLRGEGGMGSLHVGNRQGGSSLIPLILEINEDQYKLCSHPNGNPILQKIVTLHNTGNMKTIIHDISFGPSICSGQGFSVSLCSNIELEANGKYELNILFQPDYASDEINETLILNTNIGLMTFPILVRIPQRVLSACYQTISRPPWEFRPYCFCLCTLTTFIIVIFVYAVFDARRLFDNYLIRAEWRVEIQTTNDQIFDLSDLSSAIQDEQKPREQIEPSRIIDLKKEKINEIKHKRSINTNGETPSKSVRISDTPNTNTRLLAVPSKEIPPKMRRATTDSGPSKFAKHQLETTLKTQPLRRQKSDQPTFPISSSTVSEEENEPFIVARSKRILSKRKQSLVNISPKSITDHPLPITKKSSLPSDQQDLLQLDDSIDDQQWHMVSSNKGQRKATIPRRETTDESQTTTKTIKLPSVDSENSTILTPSPRTHNSVSHKPRQSRRRPPRNSPPISVPFLTKRKNLEATKSVISTNRELAFRQLTEQLWAAGLPSSTTACSMSIRSRCSSAPPSERDGGGDETIKNTWNNDDDKEQNIDWDEPDIPDEDFGRYVSQTEYSMEESNGINERTQASQKLTVNNIPSLMSLSVTPPTPIMTTNIQQKSTIPTTVIKENIEPLPFPHHIPGPIQRPNKLFSPLTKRLSSPFPMDSTQSPNTPDVLVQINHLLDHENSITTDPSTIINEISTPNVSWTPFPPTEWSSKYDRSWSVTSIQSPNISLTSQTQNPFVQGQTSKEDSTVWPSELETTTPINVSWLKFLPVSGSSLSNGQENETNNPFWSPINLHETQQNSSASWWPKTPSDENNNDDNNHSRWDFAR